MSLDTGMPKKDQYLQQISLILNTAKEDLPAEEYADLCEAVEAEASERWDMAIADDNEEDEFEVADDEEDNE